jgi:hypothetical protein
MPTVGNNNKPRTYDDEFPPDLGPPFVKNHTGTKMLEEKGPTYTVELDAGAFRALWELLEAEAKHRFPASPAITGYRAYLRAVTAFRKTYWAVNDPPGPKPIIKPRKLTRGR